MTCTDFEELSGAYVLGAVTPEEQQEADAHLAECSSCSNLVRELRTAIDYLPLSVPQVAPSVALKERVLTAIQDDAGPVQQIEHLRNLRRRRSSWRTWSSQLLAVAAILLLLLLGGMGAWNISLQQQVSHLSSTIASSAPITYHLQSTRPSDTSGISGELTYYPQQHITVLVMYGLPQPTGAHVYQGWLLKGKQPISIGLLNIDNGVATLDYPGNPRSFDAAAVSLEPGPQATPNTPAGPVLALGTLRG